MNVPADDLNPNAMRRERNRRVRRKRFAVVRWIALGAGVLLFLHAVARPELEAFIALAGSALIYALLHRHAILSGWHHSRRPADPNRRTTPE